MPVTGIVAEITKRGVMELMFLLVDARIEGIGW
jgi:hypothetical protein